MDASQAREEMVREQLRKRGIGDERILKAMAEIPREHFMPRESQPFAYEDRALSISHGQTISQPYIVALMTSMLELKDTHSVLEVGTGSGYQTAILSRLAGRVVTVERIARLQTGAREKLHHLGIENVEFAEGDGSEGVPSLSPFDRILVTAGAPHVPRPLVNQLAEDGRLVIPVGPLDRQTLTTVVRSHGRVIETPGIGVRFVKLIGSSGWTAE